MKKNLPSPLWLLPILLTALMGSGCTHLAEDVAAHLAQKDVQEITQDLTVIEGDLGFFKKCLEERGGRCQGSSDTPLPHSSQHHAGQKIAASGSGLSKTLADSVADLPGGHPAKIAHEVLKHPVTRQAAALHDHLRGHKVISTPGVAVTRGQGAHGGPESTVTLDLKLGQIHHFHSRLLASLGTRAWDALTGHCEDLLPQQKDAPDFLHLEAECRQAAFIRGYLGAYLRHGEFVEVDVALAGAIRAIHHEAAILQGDIQSVRQRLTRLENEVTAFENEALKVLSADGKNALAAVKTLTHKAEQEVTHSLGPVGAAIAADIVELLGQAEIEFGQLEHLIEADVQQDIQTVAEDLNGLLQQIDGVLKMLQDELQGFEMQLVGDINQEVDETNQELSKVFKVSNVGFLSRDTTFRAHLPTVEVTIDPTVTRWVTVTDRSTQQLLTSRTDFSHLGVVRDTSGVGTGTAIGAELVRVFLEAIFDAHEGLPAVAPANLGGIRPTGLTLDHFSLPAFDPQGSHIDSHDLTVMTDLNNAMALKARLLTGRVLSGIGPFSLNNPPLESFITEIVATSVRKAMEKATWCWYACNLNVEASRLLSDLDTALANKLREEEKKLQDAIEAAQAKLQQAIQDGNRKAQAAIEAENKKLQEEIEALRARIQKEFEAEDHKAQDWLHHEAEHVKLRVQFGK